MRGVAPRVVRRMAVDDEIAAEAVLSGGSFEEGPAHPGPVHVLVEIAKWRVPRAAQKSFEFDVRVDARMDEERAARAPVRLKPPEPEADALGQRDPDDGQELLGPVRHGLEAGELPDNRAAAVAQPRFERLERVVPGAPGIEREPHHRLVVAHEKDRFVGPERARADRQIDRPESVRTAVDEVAEKDEDAALAAPRLSAASSSSAARRSVRPCRSPMAKTSTSAPPNAAGQRCVDRRRPPSDPFPGSPERR